MSNKNRKYCEEIEKVFLAGEFVKLPADQKEQILQHLQECPHCQDYKEMLGALRKVEVVTDPADSEAFKQIKKNIINSFRQSKKHKKLEEPALKDRFKALITYKIPVYQVVGLFFVFGFAFILMMQRPISPEDPQLNSQVPIQSDTVNTGYLDLSVNLNYMDHQNVGRNLEEDSVVARYIFKSL